MHPATLDVLRFFKWEHLQDGAGKWTAARFAEVALEMAERLPEDQETTVALRKLLEAKDAAVRAALVGEGVIDQSTYGKR